MQRVTTVREKNTLTITLDDGKANVLGSETLRALAVAFTDAKDADAVLLRGRAKIFSGGLDLNEVRTMSKDALLGFLELFHNTFRTLFAFDRPLITAATGSAVAGGAILLCTGDVRLAARDQGLVGVNEVRLGVPFPASAHEILHNALGQRAAQRPMITGELYSKEQALTIGFIHELHAPEAFDAAANERLADVATVSSKAAAAVKTELRRGALERMDRNGAASQHTFAEAWTGPEAQARLDRIVAAMKK